MEMENGTGGTVDECLVFPWRRAMRFLGWRTYVTNKVGSVARKLRAEQSGDARKIAGATKVPGELQ